MIIELIGPGAVGKSTIGPILASNLGLPHYAGQGYYDIDGEPLGRSQIWADRLVSVFANPGLTLACFRAPIGLLQDKVSFTLTTTRRERFARRVRTRGMGVLSSGSVHWLCQESTRFQTDLGELLPRIALSDIYVRLSADTAEITRRLEERGGKSASRVAEHHEWIDRYQSYADKILGEAGRPVIEVAAEEAPEVVAQRIAGRLKQTPAP